MKISKKPRSVRRRWVTALAILSILIALSAFVGWRMLELRQHLSDGRDEMDLAATALSGKPLLELGREDFDSASKHLHRAEESLRPAHDELGLWEPLLNVLGGDAAAVPPLVDTALESAIAGQQLYSGLEPVLDHFLTSADSNPPTVAAGLTANERGTDGGTLSHLQDENIDDLITQLRAQQPQLRQAQAHFQLALSAYSHIDKTHLSGEIAASVAELDRDAGYLQTLHEVAGVLASAPDLLASLVGLDRPKTYLLLGQNNDELRPTGGFIGTFGLLVVRNGAVVVDKYSSTSAPYLTPPMEPCPDPAPSWWIKLEKPAWGCWDAQWTADFPTLARQAKWFYEQGKNDYAPVDGVIAIDQNAFELLLDALGPVQIPGESSWVTAQNFRSRVYLHPDAASPEPHKTFLSELFSVLVQRDLAHINLARARALLPVLYQTAAGKHILFYFEDPGLEALAARLNMDGAIQTTRGDYLFVVNTSLYDKVYDSVGEQIDYDAHLNDAGTVSARTTITWTYSATAAANDPAIIKAAEKSGQAPFLLNLTRIYLPGTSVWQSMEGAGYSAYFGVEANRLMAGTRVDVEAGQHKQVTYHYLVPAAVDTVGVHQVYRLLVQKQPGTRGADLSVHVTLPPGAELISTTPKADSVVGTVPPVLTFRAQLATDRTFEVTFKQQEVDSVSR
jgi:hypothetical protein